MVVEMSGSVNWTEPVDELTIPGLSTAHPEGYNVSLADGSVQFISLGISPKAMESMVTPNGGD